ncbi:MAG: HAD family hydrolase [Thermococci archaeon]|nr:HAD family hydrolase [Thermococci archaeon]
MGGIKAVVFDVDETLVYYDGYDHRRWFEERVKPALISSGMDVDYPTYFKIVMGELPRTYVRKFGIDPVRMWQVIDRVNLEYRKELARKGGIGVFPDVGALEELKKLGLKLAAVSNASQECTEFVLNLFNLRPYFDFVTGKDYSNIDGVKPNPYLVIKALKALDVSPEEAVMVGDSHHDVLAGKAAGLRVINLTRVRRVEGADYYARDLWEVLDIVRKLIGQSK